MPTATVVLLRNGKHVYSRLPVHSMPAVHLHTLGLPVHVGVLPAAW